VLVAVRRQGDAAHLGVEPTGVLRGLARLACAAGLRCADLVRAAAVTAGLGGLGAARRDQRRHHDRDERNPATDYHGTSSNTFDVLVMWSPTVAGRS
jgi:hypothetical protein